MIRLPTYEQLRHYWTVSQGDHDLPCALFLLKCDAEEWASQQEPKDVYEVHPPASR